MLPITILRTAGYHPMLVELKTGETYNGHLISCDNFMNVHLRDVIYTSRDGNRFWKIDECHIRGHTIKYLRLAEDIVGLIKEESNENSTRTVPVTQRSVRSYGDGGYGGHRNNYKGGRGGYQGSRNGQVRQ